MISKRNLLDIATRLGQGEATIDLYERLGGSVVPSLTIDPDVIERSPETWHGTVLLPAIAGGSTFNTFRYCVLAHAYRQRGYEPVIPLCEADLKLCHQKSHDDRAQSICDRCHYKGRDLVRQFGLEEYTVSIDLDETPTVDISDEIRNGVDLAQFALASARRHLKQYTVDLDTEPDRTTYADLLDTAAYLADVFTRLLTDHDIDTVIAHDPVYIYGGVPLAVAREHGVPAYGQSSGFRDGMLFAGRAIDQSMPHFPHKPTVKEFLSSELDADQRDEIDRIMYGRETGETTSYHFSSMSDVSVDRPAQMTTVGMFTNLIWDGSLNVDRGPFSDVLDWIFDTIDALGNHDGVELIVKTHPAEALRGTNEDVYGRVQDHYSTLPSNVTLLEPDTEVNTYELLDDLDAGVVFNSTVGLEMVYRGIPVVTGGETHYRGLDISHDPETKAEYFDQLSRIETLEMPPERTARARRYAYYLMVKKHLPFPFFETPTNAVEYDYLPVTQEKVGRDNEILNRVVDLTTSGAPEVIR